jgi:hypothetical protein
MLVDVQNLQGENGWDIYREGSRYVLTGRSPTAPTRTHTESFSSESAARQTARRLGPPRQYFTGPAWKRE